MAYPVVIEPLLTLGSQTRLWSAGFAVLARPSPPRACLSRAAESRAVDDPARAVRRAIAWPGWRSAAIPAGLVIAVTSYITTDVAAAPFLWVLPLALYLLTFVAVFRDRPWSRTPRWRGWCRSWSRRSRSA